VTHGKTAHTGTISALAIAPDGRHLLSAGQDGTLQVHDLGTGTSRTIVRGAQGILDAEWTHGGRTVTYAHDRGLFVVDVAGGPPRAIDDAHTGRATLELGSRDDRVRYLDPDGLLVERTAERDSPPSTLATEVRRFASHGERIVVVGGDSLRLVEPTGVRVLWRDPRVHHVASVAISLDGQRAVTASVDGVVEWDLGTATEARRWAVASSGAFYAGSGVYARNLDRGGQLDLLGAGRVIDAIPGDWGLSWMTPVAAGIAMINLAGALWMIDASGELEVGQAGRGQHRIASRVGSPYLAVASNDEIQWWDTRDLLPRAWTIERGSQLCGLDRERIYLGTHLGVSVLPRDGSPRREVEATPGLPLCGSGLGGSRLVIRQHGTPFDVNVIDGAAGEARRLLGSMPTAHGDSVFYTDGARQVNELAGGTSRPRWSGPASITHLAVGPTAVALALADERLVRFDRETGADVAIKAPPAVDQLAVAGDGTVWLTIGAQLHRWSDAGVRQLAVAPAAISVIGFLADGTAVVRTRDNAGWTVTPGGTLRRATEPSRRIVFGDPRVAATMDLATSVTSTYLDSGERIVRHLRGSIAIAADDRGLAVIRGTTGERLELYQDPVPADPSKLHAWIDAATNAVVDPDRDALTWR
jgi:hypothetical protein